MSEYNDNLIKFLLQHVRDKPGMYLTSPKLLYLHIFLTGYCIAIGQNSLDNHDPFLESFNDWFSQKTNGDRYTIWYPSILEECNNSEEKALLRFWEYLEEFRKRR
jgi:hypothetical protein